MHEAASKPATAPASTSRAPINVLNSLHQDDWLHAVIAGQEVPRCHGKLWEYDTKLPLSHPDPPHWKTYAQRAYCLLAAGSETHELIDALHHLFAADAEAASPPVKYSTVITGRSCRHSLSSILSFSNSPVLGGSALELAIKHCVFV